jgi:Fe2+ transport system protein B
LFRLALLLDSAALGFHQKVGLLLAAIQYTLALAGKVEDLLEGSPVADPMSFGERMSCATPPGWIAKDVVAGCKQMLGAWSPTLDLLFLRHAGWTTEEERAAVGAGGSVSLNGLLQCSLNNRSSVA